MIAFISPAKQMQIGNKMDYPMEIPLYQKEADYLSGCLKNYSVAELAGMMKINDNLAMQAFADYQNRGSMPKTPAVLAYRGLQFKYMEPERFSERELAYVHNQVRIISGLYGILRGCDGIEPYRLQMQCRIKIDGQNLYQFWGDRIYRALFQKGETVVNLASEEYAKAVKPFLTGHDGMITCEFYVRRRDRLRMLATEAKMARGRMVRFLAEHKPESPDKLKDFCWNGYEFRPEYSDGCRLVYVKDEGRKAEEIFW
ncbi:peroxide stress protein YaaA [Anaerolentibacter hominis]|uniref:peroxide stress protein YaaA n=1 Tax=Anaerolentibacter hominis TaxID=3079009 RepID=UPI0031B88C63